MPGASYFYKVSTLLADITAPRQFPPHRVPTDVSSCGRSYSFESWESEGKFILSRPTGVRPSLAEVLKLGAEPAPSNFAVCSSSLGGSSHGLVV